MIANFARQFAQEVRATMQRDPNGIISYIVRSAPTTMGAVIYPEQVQTMMSEYRNIVMYESGIENNDNLVEEFITTFPYWTLLHMDDEKAEGQIEVALNQFVGDFEQTKSTGLYHLTDDMIQDLTANGQQPRSAQIDDDGNIQVNFANQTYRAYAPDFQHVEQAPATPPATDMPERAAAPAQPVVATTQEQTTETPATTASTTQTTASTQVTQQAESSTDLQVETDTKISMASDTEVSILNKEQVDDSRISELMETTRIAESEAAAQEEVVMEGGDTQAKAAGIAAKIEQANTIQANKLALAQAEQQRQQALQGIINGQQAMSQLQASGGQRKEGPATKMLRYGIGAGFGAATAGLGGLEVINFLV